MSEEKLKICTFCSEDININAIKCKHCGEWLNKKESDIVNDREKQNKINYIVGFIILILPPILNRLFIELEGKTLFTEDISLILTISTKIALIIITFWYAIKIKIESGWAGILALLTLLPIMPWITFGVLLTHKSNLQQNKK